MEENHPYTSASGKVEIADVGCERMIIIKKKTMKALIINDIYADWRKENKTSRPPAAERKPHVTTKKDIIGTVINTKNIKDAETSILSLNVHRNIQIYIHIEEVNDECYDEGVVVRHEA